MITTDGKINEAYYKIIDEEKTFKSANFNKVEDADGFFAWSCKDAARVGGIRSLSNPKTIGDVIFWLNMAVQGWDLKNRGRVGIKL